MSHACEDVRGFLLPANTAPRDIEQLQERFGNRLNVVRRQNGDGFIYADNDTERETLKVIAAGVGLREQVCDIRRL